MKYYLVMFWMLIPVGAAAYHFGPGQEQLIEDDLTRTLALADQQVQAQQYDQAVKHYDDALTLISKQMPEKQIQVRLEKAKAQMKCGALPQAYLELENLTEQAAQVPTLPDTLLTDIKATLANAEYYVTWVLRLEGEPKEVWEPFIESSRQTYRLLAEQSVSQDEQLASLWQQDLEAAIRLERMDIEELQGLNLPSQCKCKGSCKGCCKGKKKMEGKKSEDYRTGAGKLDDIPRAGS